MTAKTEARCPPKENTALLRRAWDEVHGQGRVDSIEELVLDDAIAREPDADVRGVEELKRYLAAYLAAFPDTSVTDEDVAEADKVVSRYGWAFQRLGPSMVGIESAAVPLIPVEGWAPAWWLGVPRRWSIQMPAAASSAKIPMIKTHIIMMVLLICSPAGRWAVPQVCARPLRMVKET